MSSVDPSNNAGAQAHAAFAAMQTLQADLAEGAPPAQIQEDVKNLKTTMSALANNPDIPQALKNNANRVLQEFKGVSGSNVAQVSEKLQEFAQESAPGNTPKGPKSIEE
jgi:hypothetical protein